MEVSYAGTIVTYGSTRVSYGLVGPAATGAATEASGDSASGVGEYWPTNTLTQYGCNPFTVLTTGDSLGSQLTGIPVTGNLWMLPTNYLDGATPRSIAWELDTFGNATGRISAMDGSGDATNLPYGFWNGTSFLTGTFSTRGASIVITGTGAATEASGDSASGTGGIANVGTGATTEASGDTSSGSGVVANKGAGATTEAGGDTATGSGASNPFGSGATTEAGGDTASGSGNALPVITGTGTATEAGGDTALGLGAGVATGSGATTEAGGDSASGSGSISSGVGGSGAAIEANGDIVTSTGTTSISNEAHKMSIDFRKYVNIISGVGGAASVGARELIGRLFTNNPLVSPDSVYEFTNAADVGTFFGFASHEYRRAAFYFGWISAGITMARKIGFCRYTPTAIAPIVLGAKLAKTLTQLQAVTAGTIAISTPTTPAGVLLVGINFSAAASLAAVATALQTVIRSSTDAELATAVVAYDATNQRFSVTGGALGAGSMYFVSAGVGNTDVAGLLSLYKSSGALLTAGSAAQTTDSAIAAMNGVSTNYGSILFMDRSVISVADHLLAANYNATNNNMFMYCWPVLAADAAAVNAAAIGVPGVAATLYDSAAVYEYDEMVPMIQLAATDYSRRNGVSNYMFKSFNLTAKVSTDQMSAAYDAQRINYYGQTQINGQQRSFYQTAVLFGGVNSPLDQSVYANEQWLKDDVTVGFFNALLSLPEISTDAEGRGICRGIVQTSINAGLLNGVISVGKQLTNLQQAFITQQTGDPTAWRRVQNAGYWYDVTITQSVDVNSVTRYTATYLLIYSKDDAVHNVQGTHALI